MEIWLYSLLARLRKDYKKVAMISTPMLKIIYTKIDIDTKFLIKNSF